MKETRPTFRKWLAGQEKREGPVGDLARLARGRGVPTGGRPRGGFPNTGREPTEAMYLRLGVYLHRALGYGRALRIAMGGLDEAWTEWSGERPRPGWRLGALLDYEFQRGDDRALVELARLLA